MREEKYNNIKNIIILKEYSSSSRVIFSWTSCLDLHHWRFAPPFYLHIPLPYPSIPPIPLIFSVTWIGQQAARLSVCRPSVPENGEFARVCVSSLEEGCGEKIFDINNQQWSTAVPARSPWRRHRSRPTKRSKRAIPSCRQQDFFFPFLPRAFLPRSFSPL